MSSHFSIFFWILLSPMVRASELVASGPAPLPWAVSAQDSETTFSELMQGIEKTFPPLLAAEKQVEIAEGRKLSAAGAFDFRVEAQAGKLTETYDQTVTEANLTRRIDGTGLQVFGGWRRGIGTFRPYEGKLATAEGGEVRAGLKAPLLRDLWADPERTRRRVGEIHFEVARSDFQFRILEIKRSAADRYWDWWGARLQLDAVQRLYQLALVRLDQVDRRVQAGSTAQIELVEIKRMILQRKAQWIEAERRYQKASLDLSLFLRDPQGNPRPPVPTPNPPRLAGQLPQRRPVPDSLDSVILDALKARPDRSAMIQQISVAEAEASLVQHQKLPRLDAQVEFAADRGAAGTPKAGEKELRGGLFFSFPIENREARGAAVAAGARLDQLKQSQIYLDDQIRQEVKDHASAVRASHEKARALMEDQELSEKLAEAERKRFTSGLSSLLIVNIREQSAFESVVKSIDAATDYFKSYVRFQVVQGQDPGAKAPGT